MARRNVDLVIRARDEAKSTLGAINQALEQFVTNTAEVRDEATRTDTRLGALGSSFRELRQAVGELGATGRVERQLRNITEELTRQEAALDKTQAALRDYSRRFAETNNQTQKLEATQRRLSAELERARASVDRSKAAQRELASATGQAQRAQEAFAARQVRLNNQIAQQNTKLAEYEQRLVSLRTEISQTSRPTATLTRNFERTERAIANTRARIADLVETQNLIQASSDRAASSVQRANDIYGRQAASLSRNQAALEKTEQAYRSAAAAAQASAREQGRLEAAARETATSLERQAAGLRRAQQAYEATQATVRETAGALDQLDAATRRGLLRSLREQITRVRDAGQAYRELSGEASRLGSIISRTTNPTNAQVTAFERFRAAAAQARQEFRAQGQALSNLRGILRESGGDVEQLSNRVQRFQNVLQGARGSYAGLQAASNTAANAAQRLASEQGRAAQNSVLLDNRARRLSASMAQGARSTGLFADAIRRFYGETRTALSFTQRLRGEALSLIAAYGGFFAAIRGIQGVVDAYRTLEQAQNRLGAVFQGDEAAAAQELDFIRRQADRLGISFGALAQEYTKFAVATQGTNLEGENTRRIFRQVAEAGRVQGLSLDQLQGTFVALTQIVSKGTVSMEELRQQLGDRLPGALQILAAGLDVTTDELIKLIENGELSSDSLIQFGNELERRFADQLPEALEGTNAAIGRFQNAIFQAFLVIGRGGAIEGFTDLLNDLTEALQSAAVIDFLTGVGAALQQFFNLLSLVTQNWDLLVVAITTFLGLKIAPFIVAIVSVMGRWGAIARLVRIRTVALSATMGTFSTATLSAAGGITALRTALTLLLSSTGIGLLVTLIGTGIGIWATRASEATEAMKTHRDIVDEVKNAYDQVGGSVDNLRDSIEGVTATAARANLSTLRESLRRAQKEFEGLGSLFRENIFGQVGLGEDEATRQFLELGREAFEAYQEGTITAREFRDQVDGLVETFRDSGRNVVRFGTEILEASEDLITFEEAVSEAENVLDILTGEAEEAEEAIQELTGSVKDVADEAEEAARRTEAFQSALRAIQEEVPELKAALEELDQVTALQRLRDDALALASNTDEAAAAIRAYEQAVNGITADGIFDNVSGGGVGASAALLRQFEGFRATPYFDVNALRVGFGSDTVTLEDGSVRRVVEGTRVSVADANRDLIRRVGEFQNTVIEQIGQTRFSSFSDQQQAVLTSIAYNYGELPGRIVNAVRTGTVDEIAAAIRNLQGDNEGTNRDRRNLEADIFQRGGQADVGAFVEAEKERTRELEKQAELRADERQATADRIADSEFEISQQELINLGREREAAIASAIREARAENSEITQAEIDQITQLAGKQFDLANAERLANVERDKAKEVESEINELVQQQVALRSLLDQQLESGAAAEAIEETKTQLQGVNAQLQEAIQNALKLLSTFDQTDPAVAAVTARLTELGLQGQDSGRKIAITYEQVTQAFQGAFTNAVLTFAQGLAEGKKATEALGDAFRKFASDFLLQISQMILQQLALNAAKAIGRAFGFGVAHEGGVIGAQTARRRVSPDAFAGAVRYHQGGLAGLRPGEVPTILQRGEEVLTRDDPRHVFNGGGQTEGNVTMTAPKIVNAIDAASFVEEAMKVKRGQEAFLNYIQANRSSVRGALGV